MMPSSACRSQHTQATIPSASCVSSSSLSSRHHVLQVHCPEPRLVEPASLDTDSLQSTPYADADANPQCSSETASRISVCEMHWLSMHRCALAGSVCSRCRHVSCLVVRQAGSHLLSCNLNDSHRRLLFPACGHMPSGSAGTNHHPLHLASGICRCRRGPGHSCNGASRSTVPTFCGRCTIPGTSPDSLTKFQLCRTIQHLIAKHHIRRLLATARVFLCHIMALVSRSRSPFSDVLVVFRLILGKFWFGSVNSSS